MAIVLKDIEEFRKLDATVCEFDVTKQYLILIRTVESPAKLEIVRRLLAAHGVDALILNGVAAEQWKIFELEHKA
jgi:DNA-binding LacI/PurR family transcriptional regulator